MGRKHPRPAIERALLRLGLNECTRVVSKSFQDVFSEVAKNQPNIVGLVAGAGRSLYFVTWKTRPLTWKTPLCSMCAGTDDGGFNHSKHAMPHPENVLETMTPQLVPGERASNPALPGEVLDELDADGDTDTVEPLKGMKSRSCKALKLGIGGRIVAAREMNGLSQSDLAQALGFANSTQLSLWEQGRRVPPLHFISLLSAALSVSTDWIFGLDEAPERDSAMAARNATVRRMAALLERNAQAITDVLLETHRFDPVPMLRSSRACTLVLELCSGVEQYRARNPDTFDGTPCSALLLRTAHDAREAITKVAAAMDRAEFCIEHAMRKGRQALSNVPQPGAAS